MDTACSVADAVYGALKFCPGQVVLPGVRRRAYFIRKAHILTWPENPMLKAIKEGTPVTAASAAVITEDFTLETGKKWLPLDIEISRSNVEAEPQGEEHARTFLNRATLYHNSTGKEASGFAATANNDDLVFLIQQTDGRFRLIGSEVFDTRVDVNISLGQGPTSESGSTITIEGTDFAPAPFYEGQITIDGNLSISGVDGSAASSGN